MIGGNNMTNTKSPRTAKRLLVLVMIIAMLASFAVPAMAATVDEYPFMDLRARHASTSGGDWSSQNPEKTDWSVTATGNPNGRSS